ncbi:MAG: TGS domain-containing protein, partial [Acidimicrobiia bacterium]
MSDITISLPDGSQRTISAGTTAADVAASIGAGLARVALAARLDAEWLDLSTPITRSGLLSIVTPDTPAGREVLRHSTAHVMAQAVVDLWPGTRVAIGPAIDDGFYYDFELPNDQRFTDSDLDAITARMKAIVKEDQAFVREAMPASVATELFADQPFKREIIERVTSGAADGDDAAEVDAAEGTVSIYRNAGSQNFFDLCRGPHVPSTKRLGAFKLQKVAGAYWRGNEHGPMLQRIYG